jgi:hypothetical protein
MRTQIIVFVIFIWALFTAVLAGNLIIADQQECGKKEQTSGQRP